MDHGSKQHLVVQNKVSIIQTLPIFMPMFNSNNVRNKNIKSESDATTIYATLFHASFHTSEVDNDFLIEMQTFLAPQVKYNWHVFFKGPS